MTGGASVPDDIQNYEDTEEYAQNQEQRENWRYGQWGIDFIDPGSDDFASRLQAALTRQEWEDWKKEALPIFEELSGSIGDPELRQQQIERASDYTQGAFDAAQQDRSRRQSQYGMNIDPRVREASDSQFNLRRAASTAAARNSTRERIDQREMALMSGGMNMVSQAREDNP